MTNRKTWTTGAVWLLAALLAVGPLLALPVAAIAATNPPIVVTSADDPGDGDCATNGCTLREAINHAGSISRPGADKIIFAIPGAGPHTINLASTLPTISGRLTIDGYSQDGAKVNTATDGTTNAVLQIVLNGAGAGNNASGLAFIASAANSVVRGLVINGFSDDGIRILAPGVTIQGCFIGTNVAGTADAGNGLSGVSVNAPNATIGGTKPKHRNLLAGNLAGLEVTAKFTQPTVTGLIQGNLIGTDITGGNPIPNTTGILIGGNTRATIGGGRGAANTIAFNTEDGIQLADSTGGGNRIGRNTIMLNGGLGINLGDDGVTANDEDDPDAGPNNLQNAPVLTLATPTGSGGTKVEGTLNSTPRTEFLVQIYFTPTGDTDEGQFFLGQVKVKTNAQGDATFALKSPKPVGPTAPITATATNLKTNDTSEFSAALLAT